jgi:hypothetical protein
MFGPLNVRREGFEVVYRASGLLRAQVIQGRLEVSGIPAVLDYEALGPTLGVTIDGLGEVRVLVPTDRADEARELLEADNEVDVDESDGIDEEE